MVMVVGVVSAVVQRRGRGIGVMVVEVVVTMLGRRRTIVQAGIIVVEGVV